MQEEDKYHYLRKQAHWENLWFYQKTVTLYDMTVVFCRRFLPAHGDRTVDQMVQAARSGKQNIVEGIEDYEPFFDRWTDEEMANAAVTLSCMVDTMMQTYQKKKEKEFVTEGGIKERMTAARLDFRSDKKEELEAAHREMNALRARLQQLEQENALLRQQLKQI